MIMPHDAVFRWTSVWGFVVGLGISLLFIGTVLLFRWRKRKSAGEPFVDEREKSLNDEAYRWGFRVQNMGLIAWALWVVFSGRITTTNVFLPSEPFFWLWLGAGGKFVGKIAALKFRPKGVL